MPFQGSLPSGKIRRLKVLILLSAILNVVQISRKSRNRMSRQHIEQLFGGFELMRMDFRTEI